MTGDAGLVAAALLLGAVAVPHCASMCSVPCRTLGVAPGGPHGRAFLLGRLLGYSVLGGLVSASVGHLSSWAGLSGAVRPLWHLAQGAGLVLGAWLLITGRQPAWMNSWNPASWWRGRSPRAAQPQPMRVLRLEMPAAAWNAASAAGPQARAVGALAPADAPSHAAGEAAAVRALAMGAAWSLWPCSLLQSALVLAGLTSTPAGGAAAMGAFAVASAPGLWLGAHLLRRLGNQEGTDAGRWIVRAAGLLMLASTAWAVGRDAWPALAAWCRSLG